MYLEQQTLHKPVDAYIKANKKAHIRVECVLAMSDHWLRALGLAFLLLTKFCRDLLS